MKAGRWGAASGVFGGTWTLGGGYAPTTITNSVILNRQNTFYGLVSGAA